MIPAPGSFRSYLVLALVFIGVGLAGAWLIHSLIAALSMQQAWWLETPGALTIAAALFAVFDRSLWAWTPLRRIGLVRWPDLRGRWEGEVHSSYEDASTATEAAIEIRQTASAINVALYTSGSRSNSVVATISDDDDGVSALRYGYLNQPEPGAGGSMHIHLGSAHLRYYPDVMQLRGDYFTSRDRGTYGALSFTRVSGNLKGRFR